MVEELRRRANNDSRPAPAPVLTLEELADTNETRFSTGMGELDRVLGGGLVPGSLVLIGGDPGIGKSTLVLQAAAGLLGMGKTVLYVSGEESPAQLKMRANRLQLRLSGLKVLAETDMGVIEREVESSRPRIVVVDSIQTVYQPELSSAAGSVSQLKEATSSLLRLAKRHGSVVLLIGHVTKEGMIAGPRVLEHMVDCVLYFEGDRHHLYRILRGVKNRFGSTHEIGLFTMQSSGLKEVANPSLMLLAERAKDAPGSAVTATMEGTRPLLVEIQALVTPNSHGNPRRMSTGLDLNRVALLLSVLERHAGLYILNCDVFVNAVGGVRLLEPAVDLAVAVCLASSHRGRPVPADTLYVGEVGLTGELRGVPFLEQRLNEGARHGFRRAVVPAYSLENLISQAISDVHGVTSLEQAINALV
jgi:DNA repair protein RadA/Sms